MSTVISSFTSADRVEMAKTYREVKKKNVLRSLMGVGARYCIDVIPGLRNKKGETIYFNKLSAFLAYGVEGDNLAFGHEATMTYLQESFKIGMFKQSVKVGDWEQFIKNLKFRDDSVWNLQEFFVDKEIEHMTYNLTGSDFEVSTDNTSGNLATFCDAGEGNTINFYPNDQITGTGQIEPEDKLTPAMISAAKQCFMKGIYNGVDIGKRAPGYIGNGGMTYAAVIDSWGWRDMQDDPKYQAICNAAYSGSGPRHPYLNGEVPPWDGVRLFVFDELPLESDWGSGGNVQGCKGLFFGRQAAVYAEILNLEYDRKDLGFKHDPHGLCGTKVYGFHKTMFDSDDNGLGILNYACKEAA